MAKIALLIGVSEYGQGLPQLSGTQQDIQSLEKVLANPNIGGFDQVELLANPDRTQMERAIEQLFSEGRSKDDLILLYFSGHGVKDENGTLYFANRITEQSQSGRILTSTTVPSSALEKYMSQSRSKRQVLILDCCFSGAFGNDMKAKRADDVVDIKAQLGSEGRAVLTSSTATQASYERDGTSIYTRYLVQGLETGAAAQDDNGQITVRDLHKYAKEKVQEAAPAMQPEIYIVREGYDILLAQAQRDGRSIYRKQVEALAKKKRGKLSPTNQRALKVCGRDLGLSAEEIEQITQEVLQPYEIFWANLKEFEEAMQEILVYEPQLSTNSLDDLEYLQQVLKLRDEDVAPVLEKYRSNLILPQEVPSVATTILEAMSVVAPTKQDDLSSEKGIDYTRLRDLLKAQDWKGADYETYLTMVRAVGREQGDWIREEELLNFPCTDLKTIDRLWVKYSNGHFGFSVQKKIYVECGAKLDGNYPGDEIWRKFGDRVGWRKDGKWLMYDNLTPSLSSPLGIFPVGWGGGGGWGWFWSLLSHRDL